MISLYDILEASNGQLFGEPTAHLFTDFCFDSRRAQQGQFYVAIKTERGDGHRYIREAIENGVRGILCARPPEFDVDGVSVAIVKDTETALMAWARFILKKLGTSVIGVTGSAGKSVTVAAIAQVLATRHPVYKSTGVYGGRLDMMLALSRLTPEHKIVVLELGVAQPGEMAEMVQAVNPEVGVVLNVGHAHTDSFSTLQEIAKEKATLVNKLPATGLAVLNYDDDLVREMQTSANVLTIGMERFGADLMAYNIVLGSTKTGFDLRRGSERFVGRWTPLLGKHQLYSLLAALAVGTRYNVPLDDALRALTKLEPLPGRMNPLRGVNGATVVDDSTSATPESALAALEWLKAVKEENQRTIFVLGDMDNLGTYNQHGHRLVGQRAAEVANMVIAEGTNAAMAGRAALDHGLTAQQVRVTYSLQDAVAALKNGAALADGDLVLVTGGPTARMELVSRELLHITADEAKLARAETLHEVSRRIQHLRPTWIEIDLDAVAANVRLLKGMVGDGVTLMGVVKANAYGHGAVSVAMTALLNGAEYLAVANMAEALELREAGIDAPILVLGYTPDYAIWQAIRQNITVTLYDLKLARDYDRAAREIGGKVRVHVKIDTGMGRLGILPDDAMAFFRHLPKLPHIEVEGIYTHFAMSDEISDFTEQQVQVFKGVINPVKAAGFQFKYIHCSNSAAMLAHQQHAFNMVRAGVAMYGLSPSDAVLIPKTFRPVMTWKTVVASVKTLPPSHTVGYGNTYTTRNEERIAVIPVGYADGFRRKPNNWGEVLVHGKRAPIVGRVSMEKTTINVSNIPDVSIGDEVVLIGQQGDDRLTAEEIAAKLGTNNYDVVCNALPRVPRR